MQLSFYNFTFAEELFAKALQSFETCVLVNRNLCRKLLSLLVSPTTFAESFKVNSVHFLFQISIYEVANQTILRLKCCVESFDIDIILKQNKITTLSQFLVKNLKCFFCFFNNEKHCCINIQISFKINLLCFFGSASNCLLFTQIYCYCFIITLK